MSWKDKQGIARGQCTQCSCVSYTSETGLLCAKCRHPPTKHEKVGNASATGTSPKPSSSAITTTSPPASMNYAKATAGHHIRSDHYDSVTSHNYQAEVPKCNAIGCLKSVHYEKEFGFFKYCSPKCRDDHLLPEYNIKLDEEIDNYRYLQTDVSIIQKSPIYRAARGDSSSNEVRVALKLKPKEPFGFILLNQESRMVVVGTKTEGALRLIRERKLHLLDRIMSINGQTFSEPSQVAEYADPKTTLDILIDRTCSLCKNAQSIFIKGKSAETKAVICLHPSPLCDYGFCVDKEHKVMSVHEGSEADRCGLQRGDKIVFYASADNKTVHEIIYMTSTVRSKFEHDIKIAVTSNFCLVIGIHKSYE